MKKRLFKKEVLQFMLDCTDGSDYKHIIWHNDFDLMPIQIDLFESYQEGSNTIERIMPPNFCLRRQEYIHYDEEALLVNSIDYLRLIWRYIGNTDKYISDAFDKIFPLYTARDPYVSERHPWDVDFVRLRTPMKDGFHSEPFTIADLSSMSAFQRLSSVNAFLSGARSKRHPMSRNKVWSRNDFDDSEVYGDIKSFGYECRMIATIPARTFEDELLEDIAPLRYV